MSNVTKFDICNLAMSYGLPLLMLVYSLGFDKVGGLSLHIILSPFLPVMDVVYPALAGGGLILPLVVHRAAGSVHSSSSGAYVISR